MYLTRRMFVFLIQIKWLTVHAHYSEYNEYFDHSTEKYADPIKKEFYLRDLTPSVTPPTVPTTLTTQSNTTETTRRTTKYFVILDSNLTDIYTDSTTVISSTTSPTTTTTVPPFITGFLSTTSTVALTIPAFWTMPGSTPATWTPYTFDPEFFIDTTPKMVHHFSTASEINEYTPSTAAVKILRVSPAVTTTPASVASVASKTNATHKQSLTTKKNATTTTKLTSTTRSVNATITVKSTSKTTKIGPVTVTTKSRVNYTTLLIIRKLTTPKVNNTYKVVNKNVSTTLSLTTTALNPATPLRKDVKESEYFDFPSVSNATTTVETTTVIYEDVIEYEELTTDPFSKFLEKMFYCLASMNITYATRFIRNFDRIANTKLNAGSFHNFGGITIRYIENMLPGLETSVDLLQRMFSLGYYSLKNRRQTLAADTNELLDFVDMIYEPAEETLMQKVLNDTLAYPNTAKSAADISTDFLYNVFINPSKRLSGTNKGNVLFKSIDNLIVARHPEYETRRHVDTYASDNDPDNNVTANEIKAIHIDEDIRRKNDSIDNAQGKNIPLNHYNKDSQRNIGIIENGTKNHNNDDSKRKYDCLNNVTDRRNESLNYINADSKINYDNLNNVRATENAVNKQFQQTNKNIYDRINNVRGRENEAIKHVNKDKNHINADSKINYDNLNNVRATENAVNKQFQQTSKNIYDRINNVRGRENEAIKHVNKDNKSKFYSIKNVSEDKKSENGNIENVYGTKPRLNESHRRKIESIIKSSQIKAKEHFNRDFKLKYYSILNANTRKNEAHNNVNHRKYKGNKASREIQDTNYFDESNSKKLDSINNAKNRNTGAIHHLSEGTRRKIDSIFVAGSRNVGSRNHVNEGKRREIYKGTEIEEINHFNKEDRRNYGYHNARSRNFEDTDISEVIRDRGSDKPYLKDYHDIDSRSRRHDNTTVEWVRNSRKRYNVMPYKYNDDSDNTMDSSKESHEYTSESKSSEDKDRRRNVHIAFDSVGPDKFMHSNMHDERFVNWNEEERRYGGYYDRNNYENSRQERIRDRPWNPYGNQIKVSNAKPLNQRRTDNKNNLISREEQHQNKKWINDRNKFETSRKRQLSSKRRPDNKNNDMFRHRQIHNGFEKGKYSSRWIFQTKQTKSLGYDSKLSGGFKQRGTILHKNDRAGQATYVTKKPKMLLMTKRFHNYKPKLEEDVIGTSLSEIIDNTFLNNTPFPSTTEGSFGETTLQLNGVTPLELLSKKKDTNLARNRNNKRKKTIALTNPAKNKNSSDVIDFSNIRGRDATYNPTEETRTWNPYQMDKYFRKSTVTRKKRVVAYKPMPDVSRSVRSLYKRGADDDEESVEEETNKHTRKGLNRNKVKAHFKKHHKSRTKHHKRKNHDRYKHRKHKRVRHGNHKRFRSKHGRSHLRKRKHGKNKHVHHKKHSSHKKKRMKRPHLKKGAKNKHKDSMINVLEIDPINRARDNRGIKGRNIKNDKTAYSEEYSSCSSSSSEQIFIDETDPVLYVQKKRQDTVETSTNIINPPMIKTYKPVGKLVFEYTKDETLRQNVENKLTYESKSKHRAAPATEAAMQRYENDKNYHQIDDYKQQRQVENSRDVETASVRNKADDYLKNEKNEVKQAENDFRRQPKRKNNFVTIGLLMDELVYSSGEQAFERNPHDMFINDDRTNYFRRNMGHKVHAPVKPKAGILDASIYTDEEAILKRNIYETIKHQNPDANLFVQNDNITNAKQLIRTF